MRGLVDLANEVFQLDCIYFIEARDALMSYVQAVFRREYP